MADFATIELKAEGDPQFLLIHLGITADTGYGYRTDPLTGVHTLVIRTEDLEKTAQAIENYDQIYLESVLKPAALDRAWMLRKENMARMVLPTGDVFLLDDTTLTRLADADQLIDRAQSRNVPLAEISWELAKGTFVKWPAQLVQDTAFAAGMHVQQTFAHQSELYDAIRAATTAAELEAVNLEEGWPNQ